jgi:hypothetical protein
MKRSASAGSPKEGRGVFSVASRFSMALELTLTA